MKKVYVFFLLAGAVLTGVVLAQEEALREWTSVNGNVVEAAFVREEDGKVFLKLADGKTISTSREKLSPNDLAWIDGRSGTAPKKAGEAKTESFTLIKSQQEKLKLTTFLTLKRIIIKTYAEKTDNHRDNKSLAFLLRDASEYGWSSIVAECYPLPNGQRGRVKTMSFYLPSFVDLKEAVQIMREKFVVVMPDPVVMKEIREYGTTMWEAQNPPDYISRILLIQDSYSGKISRFVFHFPEPEKK